MTTTPQTEKDAVDSPVLYWMSIGWLVLGPVVFTVTAAIAYRPTFDSAGSIAMAILPFVVLMATMTALVAPFRSLATPVHLTAAGIALGGWAVLMFDDENWLILTFVLYAVCFSVGRRLGIVLAGIMSSIWTLAWIASDEPAWILPIPIAVFVVGSLIALTIYRVETTNEEQAELIRLLTTTREELAAAERSKGILEERARFASEIHDTLAQGLTSIVLVS